MPTDAAALTPARSFLLRGLIWSLGLFGLMRLAWVESHLLLTLTQAQGRLAQDVFGAAALPISVTLACSGADAMALCAGAILAYPVPWRQRLAGAAGGIGIILALNTIRIGTLGRAAGSPAWFALLHLYAWPALLMLAIGGYVFAWMHAADRAPAPAAAGLARRTAAAPGITPLFMLLTGIGVVLFAAAVPLYGDSRLVLAAAEAAARLAAGSLGLIGIAASASGNVLTTTRGAFAVTQECVTTPLIPVYVAASLAYAGTWTRRAAAVAATVPLFIALGALRLLVVALPVAVVASPLFLIHAFYQLLLAAVAVAGAAVWRYGRSGTAVRRAAAGITLGGAFVYFLGLPYGAAIGSALGEAAGRTDAQGALALLPGFQIGLYLALSVALFTLERWRAAAAGAMVLALLQVAAFAALDFAARYAALTPQVRDVRAWALAAPIVIVAALVSYAPPRR